MPEPGGSWRGPIDRVVRRTKAEPEEIPDVPYDRSTGLDAEGSGGPDRHRP